MTTTTAGSIPTTDFFAGLPAPLRARRGPLDLYTPADEPARRRPAVLFVHGGPVPANRVPTPRDSDVFAGYGALAAARGLAGIMFDHRLRMAEGQSAEEAVLATYHLAADDVSAAVEFARGLDGVDPDRIALWFFSVGGGLAAEWLRSPPPWLRALAWTYPLLAPSPDWPGDVARFDSVSAVEDAPPALPKLLVRVGAEYPQCVQTQDAMTEAARQVGSALELIELPWSAHGYEVHGRQPDARDATERAMAWVADALGV